MESVGARLKRLRRVTKTTQKALGEYCGVSDVTVGYWEKDLNIPKAESLLKLAKYFNTSEAYILYGTDFAGLQPLVTSVRKIPILSWVQAGVFTESESSELFERAEYWMETGLRVSSDAFALTVRGDSMTNPSGLPSIPEGATVIIDPHMEATHGKIVVARIAGTSEATMKKLVIDGPNKYLVPLNPRYANIPINGNCEIIGVVRGVQYEI